MYYSSPKPHFCRTNSGIHKLNLRNDNDTCPWSGASIQNRVEFVVNQSCRSTQLALLVLQRWPGYDSSIDSQFRSLLVVISNARLYGICKCVLCVVYRRESPCINSNSGARTAQFDLKKLVKRPRCAGITSWEQISDLLATPWSLPRFFISCSEPFFRLGS